MIVENQPAWNTHLRSSALHRKAPERHFTDVSLAVAALGANKKSLLSDLKFTGFLFESLATHELRVYPQAPHSLNIITGTGISYTRADGINIISLASLGV